MFVDNVHFNDQYFPAGSLFLPQFKLQFCIFKWVPLIFKKLGISL